MCGGDDSSEGEALMASLAAPAIRLIATRVIQWLAAATAAGAAAEAARQRTKDADDAKTTPISRAEPQTKTKEKCKVCTPDMGRPFVRSTAGWSPISIEYQARIGGMPVGPGVITEWQFSGVTFDGFASTECLLKEAKAKYDQFFDEFGGVYGWWESSAKVIELEAYRQASTAVPRPPVRLRWHFMQPVSYRYFSQIIQAAFPDIEVVFQP
ncbi:conserved protein of unknown function [Cupriavidus taiwanensis]|uniref:Tox-REase-5 domain-containing protein n=2 Tax=Cupriavidus taiwanensis TaxID=164546 RepID=A0A7Z7J9Y6_9BURK|nr:conserved hypothetical protein [Cupriavidus taiwanensis]SPC19069.1 conserved hypothetical protein [Cupriavidus taiwanensis]SPD41651.1 conserved protein of unknown function [Cupriavidus taiwanensis]